MTKITALKDFSSIKMLLDGTRLNFAYNLINVWHQELLPFHNQDTFFFVPYATTARCYYVISQSNVNCYLLV